jgi:hypothetical protein
LSSVFICRLSVEVAAKATGAVGVVSAEADGDVGRLVDRYGEAKLLAPELVGAQLCPHKHGVRRIGKGKPVGSHTHTHTDRDRGVDQIFIFQFVY